LILGPDSNTYGMLLDWLCKTVHTDKAFVFILLIDAFCKNKNLGTARDLFIKLLSEWLHVDFKTEYHDTWSTRRRLSG